MTAPITSGEEVLRIVNEAVRRIAALYRIEADIRGCGPNTRRASVRSRPILAELEPRLREKSASSAGRARSPRRSATGSRIVTASPVSATTGPGIVRHTPGSARELPWVAVMKVAAFSAEAGRSIEGGRP